jgi:hypothetical protein
MAHLRRGDDRRSLWTGLVGDLFFFNWPLRRLLHGYLRECEGLADLFALRRGAHGADLARSMVKSVRQALRLPRSVAALGGGSARSLTGRVRFLTAPPRRAILALQITLLILTLPWVPGYGGSRIELREVAGPHHSFVHIAFGYAPNPIARLMGVTNPYRSFD